MQKSSEQAAALLQAAFTERETHLATMRDKLTSRLATARSTARARAERGARVGTRS